MAVTEPASTAPAAGLAALAEDDPMIPYMTGSTGFFASRADPRFSYCLYVPRDYRAAGARLPLLVSVHGGTRTAERYRDVFAEFAEEHQCVVLAPLLPMNTSDLDSVHNYKALRYDGVRFDHLILSMVDEVTELWRLVPDRFYLFGFSAGGQFAHRFAYLHPDRLAAVSVGSPGWITRPGTELAWPDGLGGAAELFGTPPHLAGLAEVPVQLVVGGADDELSQTAGPRTRTAAEVRTRVGNVKLLWKELTAHGIKAELAVVPGATHSLQEVFPAVREFFSRQLARP